MRRKKEEEFLPLALACGVMLMLGWFTLTSAMGRAPAAVDSDLPRAGVPVLLYHHLLPQEDITGLFADNDVVVSVEQFTADMELLKARGYQTVGLRQLEEFVSEGRELPPKSVLITFDDGYLSNRVYAMPVLQRLGYTAVLFTLTGWVEESPQEFQANALQYLSWPEIWEMAKVFQFASHTDNLHALTWNGRGALLSASAEDARTDIARSIKKLKGTVYFSYPYGQYNETVRRVLADSGIRMAFTVEPRLVRAGDDPLTLGRWDMYRHSLADVLDGEAEEMLAAPRE